MVTTAVRARVPRKKADPLDAVFTCQLCKNGNHGSCPRVVWHARPGGKKILWVCKCSGEGHPGAHCTECKNEDVRDVNPETWSCLDRHACATRLETRRQNSHLWQMLQAAKSRAAVIRRAKRLNAEAILLGIDPEDDAKIENLQGRLDALVVARETTPGPRKPRTPRSKSGICECCGEATRGGRFLPGHDAKLVSALRLRVKTGDDSAYEELKTRGWLKKLPPALIRREDATGL